MKLQLTQMIEEIHMLPLPSSTDLIGRQSVRATFKLTIDAIKALNVVAAQLGIKQKSLFDHLMEDSQSLSVIAKEINPDRFQALERIPKTFVISRKTLLSLQKISKLSGTPRDALVEYSIKRLEPVIMREREKNRSRKEILHLTDTYFKEGQQLLKKARAELGNNDPVSEKLESAVSVILSAYNHIESLVSRGKIMENFHLPREDHLGR
jgi:hypothetical protein